MKAIVLFAETNNDINNQISKWTVRKDITILSIAHAIGHSIGRYNISVLITYLPKDNRFAVQDVEK